MIDETKIRTRKPPGQRSVPRKNPLLSPQAQILLAEIMTFLCGRPDDLMRFFELTGLTPQTLREAAATPGFAASVLDYLCGDERLLQAFSAESDYDPAEVDATRLRLVPPDDGESG